MPSEAPSPAAGGLRQLLGLAWPVIVSRSAQVVVGLADALMVVHLGEEALAAVTTGSLNAVAAFIFPMGVAFIVASFSSQLTGRGDAAGARRYGLYGLALALLAQALVLLGLPWLPRLVGALGYAPGVESLLVSYLSIRLLSTGLVVGMEALGNYYAGLGNTAIYMKANLAAMALNLPLNWLLIDGRLGFPALGVEGAAWASVASTGLAFGGFLAAFLLAGRGLPRPRLRLRELLRTLRFGLPSGLNWAFEFYAFLAFVNLVVGGLGTTTLAAWMAVMQVNSASFMPAFGLSSAGAVLVGQAIGAGRRDEVPGLVKLTFLTIAAWMGLVGLAYLALPSAILAPFVPAGSEQAFLGLAVRMLMLSAAWQLFDAAGITLAEALRAAGDTAYTMWARGVLAWLVFLPGGWVSVKLLGGRELAALAWLLAYLALLALALWLRFRGGAWRRITLVEEDLGA